MSDSTAHAIPLPFDDDEPTRPYPTPPPAADPASARATDLYSAQGGSYDPLRPYRAPTEQTGGHLDFDDEDTVLQHRTWTPPARLPPPAPLVPRPAALVPGLDPVPSPHPRPVPLPPPPPPAPLVPRPVPRPKAVGHA